MRNKQRGVIAQAYLYGAGLLLLVTAVGGAIVAWHSLTKSIDKAGYDRGVAETDKKYVSRDNQQLQAVIVAKDDALKKADAAEAHANIVESNYMANYRKGVTDGKSQTAVRIAAGGRLRDANGQAGTCPAVGSGIGAASPINAASGNNGPTGCELSAKTSGDLYQITGDADAVAIQLTAAQARILSDLQVCQ